MPSDTRETILQVANRLFTRQGYTATSIRQIAAEAGIGKATIYHHFTDKQAIIQALFEGSIQEQRQVLASVKAEMDPRRRIEVAVEATLHFFHQSVDLIQVVRREVTGGRGLVQSGYQEFLRQHTDLVTEALEQGIAQGLFRPVDPAESAYILMAMLQGTFALTYVGGEQPRPPEVIGPILLDVFFHGIET